MPVTADWSQVRDYEELHKDEYQWALTQAFMATGWGYGWFDTLGMGHISEENAGEVWARLAILQGMGIIGMTGMTINDKVAVTKEDVIRRIGLRSNYATLTRAKWITEKLKRLMDYVAEDVADDILRAKELVEVNN